jgi:hypothetical protein
VNKIRVLIALFFVNVLNINCSHGKDIENDTGIDMQMDQIACYDMFNETIDKYHNYRDYPYYADDPSDSSIKHRIELRAEFENYFEIVLMKNLSYCVNEAVDKSNYRLLNIFFKLGSVLASSADESYDYELAKFYANNPKITISILLNFGKDERGKLINHIKGGLDSYDPNNKSLEQALDKIE